MVYEKYIIQNYPEVCQIIEMDVYVDGYSQERKTIQIVKQRADSMGAVIQWWWLST